MGNYDKHRDNAYLSGLDMTNATTEQIIAWLRQIIDNELAKPEKEIDAELIFECSNYLEELTADDMPCAEEELQNNLKKITGSVAKENGIKPLKKQRRKIRYKAIATIAAAFMLALSAIAVTAKVNGYSAFEFVKENIQKIFGMDSGETLEGDGITLIKNSGQTSYSSIEELLEKEKLDIFYPSVLPDGIKIKSITKHDEDNEHNTLSFTTSSKELSISISNYYKNNIDMIGDATVYKTSFIDFYIQSIDENDYMAIGQYNNFEYMILFNDYDELISILNNLKEVEK